MYQVYTFLLLLIAATGMTAQNATLLGVVVDAKSNEGLFGATIAYPSGGTTSDLDGRFTLQLPAGTHTIEVNYIGYETVEKEVTLKEGEEKDINFTIFENPTLLNTATVTGSKYEKPLSEVTVSLEVLKPSLIENTNANSIKGVLDRVPGLNFVGNQANIRGGSGYSYGAGSRVLLLIDDIPYLQADSGVPQWADVPFENLEQIEVIKGAASALYGSSALNGVINARTAYAKSKPETKIAPYYRVTFDPKNREQIWYDEQPRQIGASFSHKRKIGKVDMIVAGFYQDNNSHNQFSDSRRARLSANLRYRITERLNIAVNANYNHTEGESWFYWRADSTNDFSNLRRPDEATRSEGESTRYNFDPSVTYFDGNGGKHKLLGRYYNTGNDNQNESGGDQSNTSRLTYTEYQYQNNFDPIGLVATSGLVWTRTRVSAPLYGGFDFTTNNYAAYLQLDKKVGEKLNLSTGVRYERNVLNRPEILNYEEIGLIDTLIGGQIKEARPVFRVGANYQLTAATFIRSSWGQGYRFPTVAEKYIYTNFGGATVNPNLDLQSETGWTAELAVKQGYKIGRLDGFIDIAGFWSEYQDMMEFNVRNNQLLGGFQSLNVGDTRIRGLELSVAGSGDIGEVNLSFLGGYLFLDPRFKEFDINAEFGTEAYNNAVGSSVCSGFEDPDLENCVNILKYRSRHSAKLDLQAEYKKFSFGVAGQYNSQMVNIDNILEIVLARGSIRAWRRANDHGVFLLSARAGYQLSEFWKISLIGDNLTNVEWMSRPGQLDSPATLAVRFDFDF